MKPNEKIGENLILKEHFVLLQQAGNITCDFIKANRNITRKDVIIFLRDVIRELKKSDYDAIDWPEPPKANGITIKLSK